MDKRCSNKNWGLFRLIEKNARYHAFQILLHFEQSNKQLKIIRNNYYDKNNDLSKFKWNIILNLLLLLSLTKLYFFHKSLFYLGNCVFILLICIKEILIC